MIIARGDYDYQHASSNTQFIALLIFIGALCGVGLTLGLIMLMILL